MKKTNTFTNIAMLVLFAAMAVYLGVYLFRSTQQSYATAPAVLVTVSEGGQASGIVVREEQIIASDKEFLSLSVDDGKQVARGGEIAIGVDSKAALDSASRARELKKEIAYVSSLLSRAGSASGASGARQRASTAPSCSSTPPSPQAARPSLTTSAWTSARCSSVPRRAPSRRATSTRSTPSCTSWKRPVPAAAASRAPAAGLFTVHGGRLRGADARTSLENLTPDGVAALEHTAPTRRPQTRSASSSRRKSGTSPPS
ncbi:MAG: hypothetical protein ACLUNO_13465 [Oscillospiraceae bacterium]